MRNRLLAAAATLALAVGTGACGSASDSGSGGAPDAGSGSGPASGAPAKLTVWIMDGSVTDELIKRFETDYEAARPNVDLDIQIQAWDGIGERVTAALASTDAPDVIEVGNTQVAQYAASGGVKDLTDKVADLGGDDWIPGLAQPGNIDGKQYGVPWYAANRVVVYNKDLFAKAGITTPPTTRDEWLEITAKLDEGGNQGIYLTGQTWYALAGFIWDEEATSRSRRATSGRAPSTPRRRSPGWTSTSGSRPSARGRRTPTRRIRRSTRSSRRAKSPR
nr:hypothetical protein GCM10020093_071120 [Planobispora longispora]